MAPSVESIDMKLVVVFVSDVPAYTRSSVLMLKWRCSPQGEYTIAASSVVSVPCQSSLCGPFYRRVLESVCDMPWK